MIEIPNIALHACGTCPGGNPGRGGYAAIVAGNDGHQSLSGGYRATTNNRLELHAVLAGLALLPAHPYFTIYSHSRYLVNAIEGEWIPRWIHNGWISSTGATVMNRDLWEALYLHLSSRTIHARWVGKMSTAFLKQCLLRAKAAANDLDLPVDSGFESQHASRAYVSKWERWLARRRKTIAIQAARTREKELNTMPAGRTIRRRPRAD